jgi:hypothetical protein
MPVILLAKVLQENNMTLVNRLGVVRAAVGSDLVVSTHVLRSAVSFDSNRVTADVLRALGVEHETSLLRTRSSCCDVSWHIISHHRAVLWVSISEVAVIACVDLQLFGKLLLSHV